VAEHDAAALSGSLAYTQQVAKARASRSPAGSQDHELGLMKHSDLMDIAKLTCGIAAILSVIVLSLWRAGALHLP
ncbi:MAG: hypothetical protein ACKOQM_07625, partial [Novosphingobium sp.]